MGIANLDALDEQILKLIADNARIPFLEVARACHVSGAAIHQRIQKLTRLGVFTIRVGSGKDRLRDLCLCGAFSERSFGFRPGGCGIVEYSGSG